MNLIELLKSTELGAMVLTFFTSMLPVLELRGGIPFGVSLGLSHFASMLVAIVGNMVPVPFIIIFIRRIFKWMKQKSERLARIAERMERKAYSKRELLQKWQMFGLMILVAIPLPGTGAWTGALVAAVFDMRLRAAVPAIFAGVVIAAVLITGITYGFTGLFN